MRIDPRVPFISEAHLETKANALLERYAQEITPILAPPVPVEQIADFLLELSLDWLEIPDSDESPILAYLHPRSKSIRLNEGRLPYFEEYPGMYEYTLAHEIGHYQLHLAPDDFLSDRIYVYRHKQGTRDRREWQAERFASYLLMPEKLLLPALDGVNLQRWPELYRLRDRFKVSITALKIRLEGLGYIHVAGNGRLYSSQEAALRDRRREEQRLLGQGQLHRRLGQVEQARELYQQALEIARELKDRRLEAFIAWELGRLYTETDLAQAIALMSICVAYEQEMGHPDAEADARYIQSLKVRLQS